MIGGYKNEAYYFFGMDNEGLFYLDPHTINGELFRDDCEIFKIDFDELHSNITLAFYFTSMF